MARAANVVTRSFVGLRYMERFQCLGGSCEDTCCSTWTMPVDEDAYRALEARMAATPAEQAEFTRSVVRDPSGRRFASLAQLPDGHCSLLQPDGWCSLHRRYGEPLLPRTCSLYPRSTGRIGDRAELVATVSCPEVARLCLLSEDAVDFVPLPAAQFTRGILHKEVDADAADPYDANLERVRDLCVHLLTQPYPIASRLFFLAHLAHETAAYLRRGGAFDRAHFDQQLELHRRAEVLDGLHEQLADTEVEEPFALGVITQMLLARRRGPPASYARLVEAVLAGYPALTGDPSIDAPALWDEYRRKQDALPAPLRARLELSIRNFCVNQLVKTWYCASPSFLGYVQSLLVYVAVIRFLVFSHPATPNATVEGFDAAAVECFYRFARAIQHDENLTAAVVRALEAQDMQTPMHSIYLIKT